MQEEDKGKIEVERTYEECTLVMFMCQVPKTAAMVTMMFGNIDMTWVSVTKRVLR